MLVARASSVCRGCETEERFESEADRGFEACDVTLNCGGKVRKVPMTKLLEGRFERFWRSRADDMAAVVVLLCIDCCPCRGRLETVVFLSDWCQREKISA